MKSEVQRLENALSTVFERFPYPRFREWVRWNRRNDRTLDSYGIDHAEVGRGIRSQPHAIPHDAHELEALVHHAPMPEFDRPAIMPPPPSRSPSVRLLRCANYSNINQLRKNFIFGRAAYVRALQANTQKFNTRADSAHLRTTVGVSGGARCQPSKCVIDTGSDVSLLSFTAAVATGCLIETPKTMRLVVKQVQGEVMEFLGYVVAAWVLCGHMYPHIFLVPVEVEDELPEYDALIGNDLLENIGDLMVRYGRKQIILKDERLNATYQFPMPFDDDRPVVMIVDPRASEGQFTIGTEMAQIPLRPRTGPDQSTADVVAGSIIDQQLRHQVQQNAQKAAKGLPYTSRSKLDKARRVSPRRGRPPTRGGHSGRGGATRNAATALSLIHI